MVAGGMGRVLVCDDNLLMAEVVAEFLCECDVEPIGPVVRFESAMQMARERALDGAILDINSTGDRVFRSARSCRRGAFRSYSSPATRRQQFQSIPGRSLGRQALRSNGDAVGATKLIRRRCSWRYEIAVKRLRVLPCRAHRGRTLRYCARCSLPSVRQGRPREGKACRGSARWRCARCTGLRVRTRR
jgi:hypothetical protein